MKDSYKVELDSHELGIVINALNEFRTMLIKKEEIDGNREQGSFEGISVTSPVDDLLLKIIGISERKGFRRIFER